MSKLSSALARNTESSKVRKTKITLPVAVKRVGRPPGKRSDEAYRQVTAWVEKETYNQVGSLLLLKHNRKQFSELVQELLAEWLEQQAKQ